MRKVCKIINRLLIDFYLQRIGISVIYQNRFINYKPSLTYRVGNIVKLHDILQMSLRNPEIDECP